MRLFSILTFSLLTFVLSAGEKPETIDSKITDVTVFQRGAQVTRTATRQIPVGVSTLIFSGITENMDPNTIQLEANHKMTILSITPAKNYLSPENKSENISSLEKQIRSLQEEIQAIKAKDEAIKSEKAMLIANQKINSGNSAFNIEQLKQAASYFGKRLLELNLEIEKTVFLLNDKNEERKKLEQQQNQERASFSLKTNQVVITLLNEKSASTTFKLSYQVNNAWWETVYDARVDDLDQPVALTHKAKITQQTGEDWTDVNLKLATGNPLAGAQVPYMNPWHVGINNVGFFDGVKVRGNATYYNANTARPESMEMDGENALAGLDFKVTQNLTQQEYTVERKQTVTSNNQASTVILRELKLDAKYEYHAKPRLDQDVFLIAKIYNWERYDLLSGELSLFNNNTYVGKAYLSTQNPLDTLQLSLGRDKNIVVKRTRVSGKQSKTFFGSKRIDAYTWCIELRNSKRTEVNIILRDQVPVSQNEEVEVSIKDINGGKLDEPTGIIKWSISLKPGERTERKFSYEVKYPKSSRVTYF